MKLSSNRKRDKDGMLLQDKVVMKLLLQAKSRAEICWVLDMPLGTLNNSCTRIYEHMGVSGLPELLIKYADAEERQ